MSKKVEIIGVKFNHGTYEENVTEINGRLITKIDTTHNRIITMIDRTGLKVVELRIPDTCLVKITRG